MTPEEYDIWMPKLCPGYRAALETFSMLAGRYVIELGVGTGNVALAVLENQSGVTHYLGVDKNESYLAIARQKLRSFNFSPLNMNIADIAEIADADLTRADTIISSLTIHHLHPESQIELFRRISHYTDLFLHFELIAPASEREAMENRSYLLQRALDAGLSLETIAELEMLSDESDRPMPFAQHKDVWSELGFVIDVLFRDHAHMFYRCLRPKN